MRFSLAEEIDGLQRDIIRLMQGYYARVFLSPSDPHYVEGERVVTMQISQPSPDVPDGVVGRRWDMREGNAYGDEITVIADRIHIPD